MYEEFSIESALRPTAARTSVKLNGMAKVYGVLTNPSQSTEEYITGAISCLGQADRNIMFVHTSLEALSDRLKIAATIARPVNIAKSRGIEGFANVPYLNPYEYAIEGKVSEWFKKIWDAIKSIGRKILEAIVNFIRYIVQTIQSAMMKNQAKDYDKFKKNSQTIITKAEAGGVKGVSINSLPWKVDYVQLSAYIKKVAAAYVQATKGSTQDQAVLEGVSRADLRGLKTEADFAAKFSGIFGSKVAAVQVGIGKRTGTNTHGAAFQSASNYVNGLIKSINDEISKARASIDGGQTNKAAHELVSGALVTENKVKQTNISEIVKKSGTFKVLDNKWLSENINNVIASMRENEKKFTAYTKTIDKIAKNFDSVHSNEGSSTVASLSKLCAELAKARCRLNSYYSSIILELTSYALRFRRTAHIALKVYMKYGAKQEKADKKKGSESYRTQSVEELFSF